MTRIAKWAVVVFIAWWIVTSPSAAGLAVHHIGSLASHAAGSLSRFVSSI